MPPGASLHFDSRDQGNLERFKVLNRASGPWRCRTAYNCTEACPRDIPITQAIEEVRREMLFRGRCGGRRPMSVGGAALAAPPTRGTPTIVTRSITTM